MTSFNPDSRLSFDAAIKAFERLIKPEYSHRSIAHSSIFFAQLGRRCLQTEAERGFKITSM